MARYVRCIEGHVFDAETSNACPKCGASFSQPLTTSDGSGSLTDTVKPTLSPAFAAALAVGLSGFITYFIWPRDLPDSTAVKPVVEESHPAPASAPPAPEAVQPAPPPPAPAPAPSPQQQVPEPKPAEVTPAPSERAASPPSVENTDIAQRSLKDSDRDAINKGYAELLKFYVKDREIDSSSFKSLPWSPDTANDIANDVAPKFEPDVIAAAEAGHWSEDAKVVAMVIGGYKSAQENDIPRAVAQFEAAIRMGSPVAAYYLAVAVITYTHPLLDPRDAPQWFKLSADRGLAKAAYRVAEFYRDNGSSPDTQATAAKYFRWAVEHSDGDAADLALQARRGDRNAVHQLAKFGVGPKEALVSSVDVYNTRAMFELPSTASIMLDRAQLGDATALVSLFFMARDHEVLTMSPRAQAQLLIPAARRTNRLASLNLAEYLLEAEPGVQNVSEAAFWFATDAAMSDFGSADLKQAATRFAEAASRLPDDQKKPLMALVKRIVPEALTGQ